MWGAGSNLKKKPLLADTSLIMKSHFEWISLWVFKK